MTLCRRTALIAILLVACRGSSQSAQSTAPISQQQLQALVDSLMPGVAHAAGLEFKSTPKSAIRTKDQIRTYLIAKLARELPDARLDGITSAYRLLNMISDSTDLRALFLALYTEQIAGFYDPDSTTLFAVQGGGDPATLRLVLAHELVHALQHQYLPLDSILHDATDGDRQTAAQSVLEGQATLVSLDVIMAAMHQQADDAFWDTFKDQISKQQFTGSVFASAPMAIRESVLFPYVAGADFMRAYRKVHPGKVPFGKALPTSTEQILHPDRYAAGDVPIGVRFKGDTAGVIFEDTFGEFSIETLRAQLTAATSVRTDPAIGWGGDRLRVYRSAGGAALVWVSVWDEPRYAAQFKAQVADLLAQQPRAGYRIAVEPMQVGARAAVRVVVAPTGWDRWKSLPVAEIRP